MCCTRTCRLLFQLLLGISRQLVHEIEQHKIQIVVCAQSFITAFYLLRKVYDKDELYRSMRNLYQLCEVSPVDAHIIESALNLEGYDFEDACQYYSNSVLGAEVILTRDRRGFEEFDIRHITAEDFLNEYFAMV